MAGSPVRPARQGPLRSPQNRETEIDILTEVLDGPTPKLYHRAVAWLPALPLYASFIRSTTARRRARPANAALRDIDSDKARTDLAPGKMACETIRNGRKAEKRPKIAGFLGHRIRTGRNYPNSPPPAPGAWLFPLVPFCRLPLRDGVSAPCRPCAGRLLPGSWSFRPATFGLTGAMIFRTGSTPQRRVSRKCTKCRKSKSGVNSRLWRRTADLQ